MGVSYDQFQASASGGGKTNAQAEAERQAADPMVANTTGAANEKKASKKKYVEASDLQNGDYTNIASQLKTDDDRYQMAVKLANELGGYADQDDLIAEIDRQYGMLGGKNDPSSFRPEKSNGPLRGLSDALNNVNTWIGGGIDKAADTALGGIVGLFAGDEAAQNWRERTTGADYAWIPSIAEDAAIIGLGGAAAVPLLMAKGGVEFLPEWQQAASGVDEVTGQELNGTQRFASGLGAGLATFLPAVPAGAARGLIKGARKEIADAGKYAADYGKNVDELDKIVAARQSERDALDRYINGTKDAKGNIVEEGASQRASRLEEAASRYEGTVNNYDNAVKEVQTATKTLDDLNAVHAKLAAEASKKQRRAFNQKQSELKTQLDENNKKIDEATKALDEANKKMASLSYDEYETAKGAVRGLKGYNKPSIDGQPGEHVKGSIDNIQDIINQKQKRLDDTRSEFDTLKNQLEELRANGMPIRGRTGFSGYLERNYPEMANRVGAFNNAESIPAGLRAAFAKNAAQEAEGEAAKKGLKGAVDNIRSGRNTLIGGGANLLNAMAQSAAVNGDETLWEGAQDWARMAQYDPAQAAMVAATIFGPGKKASQRLLRNRYAAPFYSSKAAAVSKMMNDYGRTHSPLPLEEDERLQALMPLAPEKLETKENI